MPNFRVIGVTIVNVIGYLLLLSQRRVFSQLLVETVFSSRIQHQGVECLAGRIVLHVDNQDILLFIVLNVLLICSGSRSHLLLSLQLEMKVGPIDYLR